MQPYLPLQHAGHTATFTICVLSPASVFGALPLFSFDAFIWADALSWAHEHSCNQTTWILPQGENRSVWCVGNRSPAVDSWVYTCPWVMLCACAADTSNSHCSGTQAMSAVLLIYLSYYMSFATSVHRVIAPGCFQNPGLRGYLCITLQSVQQMPPGVRAACPYRWPGWALHDSSDTALQLEEYTAMLASPKLLDRKTKDTIYCYSLTEWVPETLQFSIVHCVRFSIAS